MESVLSSGQLSGGQTDELMEQVKQQIAVANAQELLTV
jgi:import inner membrane translocase subunit TIM13